MQWLRDALSKVGREPPENAVLDVSGATYAYGSREVLCGVDLRVCRGTTVSLLGPNGAGKSTLMRAICGRLALRSGRILINGRSPKSRDARRQLGFVPQDIALYPHLTVEENLSFFGRMAGVPPGQLADAVLTVLDQASLADRARQKTGTLSGGYQRRLNIAAAVLHKPALLLLDEPTVGIDVDAREAIHALLRSFRGAGGAVVLTTHDLEQAEILSDRILILNHGRIVLEGAPAELLKGAFRNEKEVIVILAEAPKPEGLDALRAMNLRATQAATTWFGFKAVQHLDMRRLTDDLSRAGVAVKEIRVRQPDLSSLFIKTVGEGLTV
ncbi:MAG: ABC transporter ATP-binding protein [Hyphomicrobium sp.]|jgi:ABC-2 type transport system ATP-binding protein|nr:ABC transporter ATP-binding protein [Hyphomicrobium sp.]